MIVEPPVVRGPVEPHVKGEFQPYDNSSDYVDKLDDNDAKSDSQNSDTGKEKVLTTKQKKKIEKSRNPLWQFVAKMLLSDEKFQLKRKKKKKEMSPLEEKEDIRRRADEAAIRISLKLDKAGFDDPKLWTIVKDKGPQGLCEDLRVAVLSCIIDTNPDSAKNKDVLDATGGHRTPQDATGRHRTPQDATGRHRTPQDATGRHRTP